MILQEFFITISNLERATRYLGNWECAFSAVTWPSILIGKPYPLCIYTDEVQKIQCKDFLAVMKQNHPCIPDIVEEVSDDELTHLDKEEADNNHIN